MLWHWSFCTLNPRPPRPRDTVSLSSHGIRLIRISLHQCTRVDLFIDCRLTSWLLETSWTKKSNQNNRLSYLNILRIVIQLYKINTSESDEKIISRKNKVVEMSMNKLLKYYDIRSFKQQTFEQLNLALWMFGQQTLN